MSTIVSMIAFDSLIDRPCGCKVWNATAKVCYRIRYQDIKVYT